MWHLDIMGAYAAQNISDGRGTRVLILDTGADIAHPEIQHLFDEDDCGYNFVKDTENIRDGNGHGTHVAGLVGGVRVGVAPGCQVLAGKVLSDNGWGTEASVARALDWSIDHNIDVINMSLGSPSSSPMEQTLIAEVIRRGIVVCAAAGNERYGASYPAAYPGVISVAAIDRMKQHADFSNIHETVDISAPGVGVTSCLPGGGYEAWDGTSMATPLVAGSVALLLAQYNAGDTEIIIKEYAEHLSDNSDMDNASLFGAGLIRPDLALGIRRQNYARPPI